MNNKEEITILAIESSCDDTGAAVIIGNKMFANHIATQEVHKNFGGVVPELASRAHQQNIIPVVDLALKKAGVKKQDLDAIAFTKGPGLLGSLLVGSSFAKSMALGLNIPLIEVNHMEGHVLAHFIKDREGKGTEPKFPFLCLTVSGGHTQIILVRAPLEMEILGETIDDAAGEAFDKSAKILGLPYPGGPLIDKYAQKGNPNAFEFPIPKIQGLNFSFSGVKTAFLYFIREKVAQNENFIEENLNDICASIQHTIVKILFGKLKRAVREYSIKEIAIAGGVSANSSLRKGLEEHADKLGWNVHIPEFQYCTDNAGMIAIAGYFKYLKKDFTDQKATPNPRLHI